MTNIGRIEELVRAWRDKARQLRLHADGLDAFIRIETLARASVLDSCAEQRLLERP